MLDFTWKVFSKTGNIDTYLLYREIKNEMEETPGNEEDELVSNEYPMS